MLVNCLIVVVLVLYTKMRFLSNYDTFECSSKCHKCHKSQLIVTNIARHSMHTNAFDLSFKQCALIINNHPSHITLHTSNRQTKQRLLHIIHRTFHNFFRLIAIPAINSICICGSCYSNKNKSKKKIFFLYICFLPFPMLDDDFFEIDENFLSSIDVDNLIETGKYLDIFNGIYGT